MIKKTWLHLAVGLFMTLQILGVTGDNKCTIWENRRLSVQAYTGNMVHTGASDETCSPPGERPRECKKAFDGKATDFNQFWQPNDLEDDQSAMVTFRKFGKGNTMIFIRFLCIKCSSFLGGVAMVNISEDNKTREFQAIIHEDPFDARGDGWYRIDFLPQRVSNTTEMSLKFPRDTSDSYGFVEIEAHQSASLYPETIFGEDVPCSHQDTQDIENVLSRNMTVKKFGTAIFSRLMMRACEEVTETLHYQVNVTGIDTDGRSHDILMGNLTVDSTVAQHQYSQPLLRELDRIKNIESYLAVVTGSQKMMPYLDVWQERGSFVDHTDADRAVQCPDADQLNCSHIIDNKDDTYWRGKQDQNFKITLEHVADIRRLRIKSRNLKTLQVNTSEGEENECYTVKLREQEPNFPWFTIQQTMTTHQLTFILDEAHKEGDIFIYEVEIYGRPRTSTTSPPTTKPSGPPPSVTTTTTTSSSSTTTTSTSTVPTSVTPSTTTKPPTDNSSTPSPTGTTSSPPPTTSHTEPPTDISSMPSPTGNTSSPPPTTSHTEPPHTSGSQSTVSTSRPTASTTTTHHTATSPSPPTAPTLTTRDITDDPTSISTGTSTSVDTVSMTSTSPLSSYTATHSSTKPQSPETSVSTTSASSTPAGTQTSTSPISTSQPGSTASPASTTSTATVSPETSGTPTTPSDVTTTEHITNSSTATAGTTLPSNTPRPMPTAPPYDGEKMIYSISQKMNLKFEEGMDDPIEDEFWGIFNTSEPLVDEAIRAVSPDNFLGRIYNISYSNGSIDMKYQFDISGSNALNPSLLTRSLVDVFNRSGITLSNIDISDPVMISPKQMEDFLIVAVSSAIACLVFVVAVVITIFCVRRRRRREEEEISSSHKAMGDPSTSHAHWAPGTQGSAYPFVDNRMWQTVDTMTQAHWDTELAVIGPPDPHISRLSEEQPNETDLDYFSYPSQAEPPIPRGGYSVPDLPGNVDDTLEADIDYPADTTPDGFDRPFFEVPLPALNIRPQKRYQRHISTDSRDTDLSGQGPNFALPEPADVSIPDTPIEDILGVQTVDADVHRPSTSRILHSLDDSVSHDGASTSTNTLILPKFYRDQDTYTGFFISRERSESDAFEPPTVNPLKLNAIAPSNDNVSRVGLRRTDSEDPDSLDPANPPFPVSMDVVDIQSVSDLSTSSLSETAGFGAHQQYDSGYADLDNALQLYWTDPKLDDRSVIQKLSHTLGRNTRRPDKIHRGLPVYLQTESKKSINDKLNQGKDDLG